jgi:hypothetical protein
MIVSSFNELYLADFLFVNQEFYLNHGQQVVQSGFEISKTYELYSSLPNVNEWFLKPENLSVHDLTNQQSMSIK